MRIGVILHRVGNVIIIIGLLMIIPLICSLIYGEPDTIAFMVSIVATITIGVFIALATPGGKQKLMLREALAIVALTWIAASAFSAIPYMLAGTFTSYIDAYFEAMSGYTTTGASVMTDIEIHPHGILLWRGFTQWIGGMGIITLFVAVFPMIGVGTSQLLETEVPGPDSKRLTARIKDTARALWIIYLSMTVLEVMLLVIAGMPFFDSIANTFATMATGGLSPRNLSIGAYNNVFINIIVIIFMAAAGANFGLYYFVIWKRDFKHLIRDVEFRFYLIILGIASIIIALDLMYHMNLSVGQAFNFSIFQVVSIQTTTGFVTTDFNNWPVLSQAMLAILMLIGACSGSTGGAVKVTRVLMLVKYVYTEILRVISPRAVILTKMQGQVIPDGVMSRVLGMITLYILTIIIAFILMSAAGLDFVSAITSVFTTIGNVGPGLGMVGPASNFYLISPMGKVVLIFCMLVGRLEFWAVLALFTPAFWKWR
jgi:trk system potassium uptake protein TrkH